MTDRPIIFSAPMVRALINGNKTETRRLLYRAVLRREERKPNDDLHRLLAKYRPDRLGSDSEWLPTNWHATYPGEDRLWVRESWRVTNTRDTIKPRDLEPRKMTVMFAAGGSIANDVHGKWVADDWPATVSDVPPWAGKNRPGIFLPRWASRLTLVIKATRIERLQAIDSHGALAEGITGSGRDWKAGDLAQATDPVACFQGLWWALHGIESWHQNPWVVVLSFVVRRSNIDDEEKA